MAFGMTVTVNLLGMMAVMHSKALSPVCRMP